jgi:hypothetical protein
MSNIVLASFDDNEILNEQELIKFSRDFYELSNNPLYHGIYACKEMDIKFPCLSQTQNGDEGTELTNDPPYSSFQ